MAIARNGDCELWFETFGDPADPALLLINGLGSQCISYHEDWCARFVARGLHVIRFDNRDVGWSTSVDVDLETETEAAYLLADLARDAVAVLEAAEVQRAHVMGLSMGGMIAQTMAIEHPDRVLTLISAMSSTGEPEYGQPTPEAWAHLTRPPATDRASFIDGHLAGLRIWGSPAFADEDRWRADAERFFARSFSPHGTRRQFLAIRASGSRAAALPSVTAPTLVIHGDRDTLIDPSGGRRTAELIPRARFELVEGMGHDYPPQLWDRWVDLVSDFIFAATSEDPARP